MLLEKIWQQKSRVDWIKLGDSNTKFFHSYAKARQNVNAIKLLVRSDGSRCSNQMQIKEEVRSFYQGLMGSAAEAIPMVDKSLIARGPTLCHHQQIQLCAPPSSQEIKQV